MRPNATDPTLAEIASAFKRVILPDQDDYYIRAYDNRADDRLPSNIYIMPDMKTLVVRMYFGGKSRSLAYGDSRKPVTLARLRDLFELRFWKYRARPCPPVDTSFVFSLADAERDEEALHETAPEVISLINRLERHFLDVGVFREASTDPVEHERDRAKVTVKKKRATVRQLYAGFVDEALAEFKKLNARLTQIENKIDKLPTLDDNGSASPPVTPENIKNTFAQLREAIKKI